MAKNEGYLLIDHRFSPGVPEDIARAQGFDPLELRGGKIHENATLSCAHCKNVVVKNPYRMRARESCPKCCDVNGNAQYICDWCYSDTFRPDYTHTPWDKKVDDTIDALAHGTLGSPTKLLMP